MGNSISSPSDSHSHPSRRMNAQASSAPQPVMLPVAWIMKRTSPVPLQTLSHACACKQYTNISECQSTAANTKILNAVLRAAHTRRNEPSGRTLITKDATRSGGATGLGSMPVARSTSPLAGDDPRTAASIVVVHADASRSSKHQKTLVPCHPGGPCR